MDGRFSGIGSTRGRAARRASAALALTALVLLVGCSDSGTDSANGSGKSAAATPAGGVTGAAGADDAGGALGDSTPVADEGTATEGDEAPVDETEVDEEAVAEDATEGDEAAEPVELSPGDPCSLEEGVPDCIDPDGDGEGTYLLGGADCLAAWPDDWSYCEDLDGDGYAGYPDSEGHDGDDGDDSDGDTGYGSPCSKEEGSPDCIDADGDGEGVLLQYGEECYAMYADDALCDDTDGDGVAGEVGGDGYLPFPIDADGDGEYDAPYDGIPVDGEYEDGEDTDMGDSWDTGYGSPCSLEEGSPDCIDADGDGEGVLLQYGEECYAHYADAALCDDTDGDGVAGEVGGDGELPFPV